MPDFTVILGAIAGTLTSLSMLPQLIKVLKEKKVENVSPVMIWILLSGVGCWTVFGILKSEWSIILSNGFSFIVNSIFLVYYYIFQNK